MKVLPLSGRELDVTECRERGVNSEHGTMS